MQSTNWWAANSVLISTVQAVLRCSPKPSRSFDHQMEASCLTNLDRSNLAIFQNLPANFSAGYGPTKMRTITPMFRRERIESWLARAKAHQAYVSANAVGDMFRRTLLSITARGQESDDRRQRLCIRHVLVYLSKAHRRRVLTEGRGHSRHKALARHFRANTPVGRFLA